MTCTLTMTQLLPHSCFASLPLQMANRGASVPSSALPSSVLFGHPRVFRVFRVPARCGRPGRPDPSAGLSVPFALRAAGQGWVLGAAVRFYSAAVFFFINRFEDVEIDPSVRRRSSLQTPTPAGAKLLAASPFLPRCDSYWKVDSKRARHENVTHIVSVECQ